MKNLDYGKSFQQTDRFHVYYGVAGGELRSCCIYSPLRGGGEADRLISPEGQQSIPGGQEA